MVSTALGLYLVMHLGFLAWSFSFEGHASMRLWFLRIMLLGMAYDNLMLVLGPLGVGNDWYVAANYPRYLLHAGVLPFLTIFTLSAMQVTRVPLAEKQLMLRDNAARLYGLDLERCEIPAAAHVSI